MYKKLFGQILSETLNFYTITDTSIIERINKKSCHIIESSTIRHWKIGTNFPRCKNMEHLLDVIKDKTIEYSNDMHDFYRLRIMEIVRRHGCYSIFEKLSFNDAPNYPITVLNVCYTLRKEKSPDEAIQKSQRIDGSDYSINIPRTEAVVFDFDGTLTIGKTGQTTWESLWTSLGYNVQDCQYYHAEFEAGRIKHSEWCKITQEKFIDRGLNKSHLDAIVKKIQLIKGVRDVFEYCREHNIGLYIVSGSIHYIIREVLGNLCRYVINIKANEFKFNNDNTYTLREIIGTKYDFEGKATFLEKIAAELKILPNSILFVGNSSNDKYAHLSGVRTLCINPLRTSPEDKVVWNGRIDTCNDLNDIIKYIIV